MHYVSLIVEFLRGRPRFVFWSVALTQGLLWVLVPAIAYTSPPGEVPVVLAIGHELLLGSDRGPPLAFWLAEGAFRLAGIVGVYVLAQICIVITYYGVFALGRAIVGIRHAVLAVLLMVGIAAFTVPSPNFGPAVLAAPFWALSLLFYWRALGEGKRGAWFQLAIALGLLLLSSETGVILLAVMILFTLLSPAGRRALMHPEPWAAGLLLVIVLFPFGLWAFHHQDAVLASAVGAARGDAGVWVASLIAGTHLGMMLLIALASGFPRNKRQRAPEIDRTMPVGTLAKCYVYSFALVPMLIAIGATSALDRVGPFTRVTPLVVLSGLAVILFAGERVRLFRERAVSTAWAGLLTIPPALAAFSMLLIPWVSHSDLATAQPARAEGAFFADAFTKRTGAPLRWIAGDAQLAPQIALTVPARPHVYFDWAPERSPWGSAENLKRDGGVLVWPAPGTSRTPPARLAAQFPGLVPEVPHIFERPVRGRLPPVRIGWAVIKPEK